MMVVIGIIAILGAVVVPGFKKIYSDFKIRETYNLIDDILSSQLSFYLTHNEWPLSTNWNHIEARYLPFLSQQFRKFVDTGTFVYYKPSNPGNRNPKRKSHLIYYLYKGIYLCPNLDNIIYGGHFMVPRYYRSCIPIADKVHYLDDLCERYRKKGCDAYLEDGNLWILLPGGGRYENGTQYDSGVGYNIVLEWFR